MTNIPSEIDGPVKAGPDPEGNPSKQSGTKGAVKRLTKAELMAQNAHIQERLNEAEEALRAIYAGEVDAFVVAGEKGEEIHTIQEAEYPYRMIFEMMNEGVAMMTRAGLILYYNARWGALLDQPLGKLVGLNITPFIIPESRGAFRELISKASIGMVRAESVLRRPDGTPVPVQLALSPVDLDGEKAICVVASDISDLKQSDERLHKNEERFRLLIEDVPGYAIFALDKEGYVESWNLGAERMKGYRADEVLGSHFSRFFSPEDIESGMPGKLLQTAREKGRVEGEGWRKRKDGSAYWAHLVIATIRNQAGEPIGFSVVSRDSTQQKEAEEALRLSEELFHSAVDYFPGGFAIYDTQKRFQFVNKYVSQLSGLSQQDFIGHTNEELFPPEMTSRYLPMLDRCFQERKLQTVEATFTIPLGTFVFSSIFVPILGDHGELRQVLGIGYDITARREAEEKVEAALKKEQILRREIQHRVKNSIQIISSLLFLQSREVTDPKMGEVLRECQSRARSIALVYAMLSQREDIARINFSEYAHSLVGALCSAYEIRHDVVRFTIEAENIPLDLDAAVPCGLILTELVSNSIKYAFPDGRKGEVIVSLRREGEMNLALSCRDNGVGLPAGFDLDKNRSLGLRLVRDLVDQLGGKLVIQSEHGTWVRIVFPAKGLRLT